MTITIHRDLIQGSEEWLAARCGLLTASEMRLVLTPKLQLAANDKSRAHYWELLSQRITGHVEPSYVSDDMLRGQGDEILARSLYAEHRAPVDEVGFVTNDAWGFTLGCSPDGLVGDDGMIECKSRRQRFQVETLLTGKVPDEYVLQCQTALLVTDRKWLDFVSYSGGLPMAVIRVLPDGAVRKAILNAAEMAEGWLAVQMERYAALPAEWVAIKTERTIEEEMRV